MNFDGQPQSKDNFIKQCQIKNDQNFHTLSLIQDNLSNPQSRYLLLIIRGDALIPLLSSKVSVLVNNQKLQTIDIHGSTFQDDFRNEGYNLKKINTIINYLNKEVVLTFKDLNNSIQTSIYDLFNQSFYYSGSRKYVRISLGKNYNNKIAVNKNLKFIVFIKENELLNTDLAFLNRFQKHQLNLGQIIDEDWIKNLLDPICKQTNLKYQNFLINPSQESIVTLLVKHQNIKDLEQRLDLIKMDLLWNRTLDFQIDLENETYVSRKNFDQIYKLLQRMYGNYR